MNCLAKGCVIKKIDINIPDPTKIDFKFNLEQNITILNKNLEELLVLSILMEDGK